MAEAYFDFVRMLHAPVAEFGDSGAYAIDRCGPPSDPLPTKPETVAQISARAVTSRFLITSAWSCCSLILRTSHCERRSAVTILGTVNYACELTWDPRGGWHAKR